MEFIFYTNLMLAIMYFVVASVGSIPNPHYSSFPSWITFMLLVGSFFHSITCYLAFKEIEKNKFSR